VQLSSIFKSPGWEILFW